MIRIAWHGCAAYTLEIGGHEILVDPLLSTDGAYANPHAPTAYEYMAAHRPERVLITDGRADHCDVAAIRSLIAIRPLAFVCATAVAERLIRDSGVDERHVTHVAPGDARRLEALQVEVFAAVPPVAVSGGQSPLAARLRAGDDQVFVSGATTAAAVPQDAGAPVAVLCVGTLMKDPVSQTVAPHGLTPTELPQAARRLGARIVVPVEWDQPLMQEAVDIADLQRVMAERLPECAVANPAYNTWTYVETAA